MYGLRTIERYQIYLNSQISRSRSLDEALATLSMLNIKRAALPFKFGYEQGRIRETLHECARNAPQDVQERIIHEARVASTGNEKKVSRKRAAQTQRNQMRKRRRISSELASAEPADSTDEPQGTGSPEPEPEPEPSHTPVPPDSYSFLDIPTEAQLADLHRDFRDATCNEKLAQRVCASCARRLMCSDLTQVNYLLVPNACDLLRPEARHPMHILTHGMLLQAEYVEDTGGAINGWICRHCYGALKRKRLPALSLANGMWIGPTPTALSMLSFAERLLIALRYPRGYVFKLHPRSQGSDHPEALQSGLKGNVTTYNANADAVVEMLTGQLMPRTTAVLPSLVAVAFVGRSKLSKSWLKSIFRIRRKVVYAALLELKHSACHPGYINLDISQNALERLPVDDIPDEIWLNIRVQTDRDVIEREAAGYVPADITEGKSIVHLYYYGLA
jgi:hypothetical protein